MAQTGSVWRSQARQGKRKEAVVGASLAACLAAKRKGPQALQMKKRG